MLLAATTLACRTAPPPSEVVVRPPVAPPRFVLPAATKGAIDGDLARANAGAPGVAELVFEEAAPAAGLLVERYRLNGGPSLLFVADPSASALTVQLHFVADGLSPDAARAVMELARPTPASEALAKLEGLGASARAGVSAGLAWLAVTGPAPRAGGPDVLAELLGVEAEAIARPAPVTDAAWGAVAARVRKHRTIDPKTMLERALTDRWPMSTGRVASFDGLDRTGAEAARAALLDPTRAVISVSGPAARVDVLSRVRASFGPLARPAIAAVPTTTAAVAKVGAGPGWFNGTVSVPGDSEVLLLAWPIPSTLALSDRIALDAIAHLLAGGEESRLGRGLLARDGLGVEARVQERASGGTFELFVALQPGRTATQAISLVDRELRTIARGETTGIEVEVVRASLRASALEELAGLESRAARLARSWLREHQLDLLDRRLEALTKLGEPEVRAVAARWLGPKPRAELTGRPRASSGKERR